MPKYCPHCEGPRSGSQPTASATPWLLLMILNVIVAICIWPAALVLPVWPLGWIVSAVFAGSQPPTCTACGTALVAGVHVVKARERKAEDAEHRRQEARERGQAEAQRRAELEAQGVDTRPAVLRWAFPRRARRRRR